MFDISTRYILIFQHSSKLKSKLKYFNSEICTQGAVGAAVGLADGLAVGLAVGLVVGAGVGPGVGAVMHALT